ncbi:relaxase/mobilization nuclease domain-containing protein [Ginsengibacter hankyongi]|uniref:Relaxase/mobilization nuclease domain-containing protein n=1 Tax=Ginsengibacter hankyongi TaxID=2607284 RepID=A0A5J5IPT5_9BACT|nr:relaxase/mobilization nuclease domain-containing protein [Ginsengibacter hankyongi]KAA9042047.1 relaxase/mobilization nuclease domain-containing protein [Ginsengibacter hankyongi]
MISKVVIGKTFYGACRYICMDKRRAVVLEADGVRDYDYKLMAKDFELQQSMRPSLTKAVFHGIISFYPGERIEDKMMAKIAREYLAEIKITDTQFAIVKHIDKNHSHLHILANLVNNNGETIKDNWIGLKGKKVAQKLTKKYGLKEAISKDLSLVNLNALNEKEANRYIIYQAILESLPQCRTLNDLTEKLVKKKIETLYKYKGQTNELQGINFKLGEYKYKGSEVDRKFSINNLQKILQQQQAERLIKLPADSLYSKSISQNKDLEIDKRLNKDLNILNELIKPEQQDQSLAAEWRLQQKRKKKSKRIHL